MVFVGIFIYPCVGELTHTHAWHSTGRWPSPWGRQPQNRHRCQSLHATDAAAIAATGRRPKRRKRHMLKPRTTGPVVGAAPSCDDYPGKLQTYDQPSDFIDLYFMRCLIKHCPVHTLPVCVESSLQLVNFFGIYFGCSSGACVSLQMLSNACGDSSYPPVPSSSWPPGHHWQWPCWQPPWLRLFLVALLVLPVNQRKQGVPTKTKPIRV